MVSMKGSAFIRVRPTVVIDLREQLEPTAGRGPRTTNGASSKLGPRNRSRHRLSVADRILAAWFGVLAISFDGESREAPVTGRVCGGNSPTKSSDRPSPGWGS